MSYEVNVLVNGSRCKQYNHNGKVFVEAKQGSEYSIEIKNNAWKRILAVCSVDGLDILNGKPAVQDGPGYVINGLNSSKFDGFRVSDATVAKFVFDYKGSSYAASKGDGSEKNVGVVGIRLFEEKFVPPPTEIHHHHHHDHHDNWNPWKPYWDRTDYPPYNPPTIWCDHTYSTSLGSLSGGLHNAGTDALGSGEMKYSCDSIPTKGITRNLAGNAGVTAKAMNCSATLSDARGFDMGTKWGEAKESRVVEVEFERGVLVLNTNIYYASRQSLLEMGVPLGNEKQVSFPEPFVDSKYSKPPKNWKG
jgi:hypothetical protein